MEYEKHQILEEMRIVSTGCMCADVLHTCVIVSSLLKVTLLPNRGHHVGNERHYVGNDDVFGSVL